MSVLQHWLTVRVLAVLCCILTIFFSTSDANMTLIAADSGVIGYSKGGDNLAGFEEMMGIGN